MSPDPDAGTENFHAGVFVGEPNDFPNIRAQQFANLGKLIGQRDVHVSVGVLH